MIDINTLYSRYDPGASASGAYYGYNAQNSMISQNYTDASTVFSIKKVYSVGNVQYIAWSNNTIAAYESDWTNRAAWFATPSNITVTATSSVSNGITNIIFNWSSSTGSSRYIANITNQNGVPITYLADASSSAVLNPEHKATTLQFINQTSCTLQNVLTGATYSISIYPSNGYGSASVSTVSVAV